MTLSYFSPKLRHTGQNVASSNEPRPGISQQQLQALCQVSDSRSKIGNRLNTAQLRIWKIRHLPSDLGFLRTNLYSQLGSPSSSPRRLQSHCLHGLINSSRPAATPQKCCMDHKKEDCPFYQNPTKTVCRSVNNNWYIYLTLFFYFLFSLIPSLNCSSLYCFIWPSIFSTPCFLLDFYRLLCLALPRRVSPSIRCVVAFTWTVTSHD